MTWRDRAASALADIDAQGRRRSLRTFDALGPRGSLAGRDVVSFASNDYLGLSHHPRVMEAAHEAIDRWGTGATASRLVVGTRPGHGRLEERYAAWKGTDRALVTASGYAANVAVLTTFAGPDVTVLSDEWNHASIIDGCRLSRGRTVVYRHVDVDHVASLLRDTDGPTIVVTDSVFSMDGDLAPVDELVHVCRRHGALLVLDEAHAALGPELPEMEGADVIVVGTLSKTLGSMGGVIAGPAELVDLVVNRARPFIFSTGLTPADTAAAAAALDIVAGSEGELLRARLRSAVDRVLPGHPSAIVPVMLGAEAEAVDASTALLDDGLLVPAIRPPTVPPGTSRLRIALSASHDDEMIDALLASLRGSGIVIPAPVG